MNANDVLDDEEISHSSYVCNGRPGYPSEAGVGILKNVPLASLTGWEVCYVDNYQDTLGKPHDILADCTGRFMMLACREAGADVLTLAAADSKDIVMKPTESTVTAHHVSGGGGWYYTESVSWGFFQMGTDLNRLYGECDAAPGEDRLCWFTNEAQNGGYRCGDETMLQLKNNWERVILTY